MKKTNFFFPLLIIAVAFFVIGFGVGINGIMVPILEEAFSLSKGMSYLVLTATFSAFLIFGGPSGWVLKKIGYKKSLVLALFIMGIGMLLFIPSAQMGASMSGFYMFLVASFVGGIGNTLLQAAVNPYVTICGPIEKAAQRMCFMGIMNKSAWYLGPIFLSLFIDVKNPVLDKASIPFGLAAGIILIFAFLIYFVNLPEVKAEGEDDITDTGDNSSQEIIASTNRKTSILQFPHLILGTIALFVYVGVETLPMASAIDFAKAIGLNNPEQYAAIEPIGLVIGYIFGIFLLQVMQQKKALVLFVLIALSASLFLVFLPVEKAIYCLVGLGFSHSIMWGALWAMAIDKLGKFTKTGASLLVVAIVGGAIFPLVFGFLLDCIKTGETTTAADFQTAYWIFIPSYLYILFYALVGYKIKLKK